MKGNEIAKPLTIVKVYISLQDYIFMKVYLCGEKGCCPYVEADGNEVLIGEEGNMCRLTREQFNELKERIIKGEI